MKHTSNQDVRLNRFLAECGICSRRKADDLIVAGEVEIDGRIVTTVGTKVDPGLNVIRFRGQELKLKSGYVYILFNKPKQVLSSMSDPTDRRNLTDYFADFKERLFPVGRLDWNSEGLLLMTNDGKFSHSVTHPKYAIPKIYHVKVDGFPTQAQLNRLLHGVTIVGGKVRAQKIHPLLSGKSSKKYGWFEIVITEGKNRQVRRMFEKIGFDVQKLKRVGVGSLKLGKLRIGDHARLTPQQASKIFDANLNAEDVKKKKRPTSMKRNTKTK